MAQDFAGRRVAPRVGAWIEIMANEILRFQQRGSRPAWARGLKFALIVEDVEEEGRAPRGRVD